MGKKNQKEIEVYLLKGKIEKLSPSKRYVISSSSNSVSVGNDGNSFYLIDKISPDIKFKYPSIDRITIEIMERLDIEYGSVVRYHISKIRPEDDLLMELHSSIKKIFKNRNYLSDPMHRLIEFADMQDEVNPSHADLIKGLSQKGVILSFDDVLTLLRISNIVKER